MADACAARSTVLVLGASGYVGGRLVARLLDAGHAVRCLARTPRKLAGMPWAEQVTVVAGDLLAPDEEVRAAFADVDVVVHLVHSMGAADEFEAADRAIARTVRGFAAEARVRRIVYLGGLGDPDEASSPHLRSRAEVGRLLRAGPVPTTILRAAVIIGSGSASFEMLRHLVEKLPVMTTPRWVDTRVQPIAIRDVLRYLVGVVDPANDDGADHVYDIGGPEVLTYRTMMQRYAQAAGLRPRLIVPVPVLTPNLSSHWVNLVTPVPFGVAKPLVQSLTAEVIVGDGEDITQVVEGPPLGVDEALRLALQRIRDEEVETSWREAEVVGREPADPYPGDPDWSGGTLLRDVRTAEAAAPPAVVFATVSGIGGDRGWPTYRWAWWLRGLIDRLVGGVGLRRGRRDPQQLRVGDALDFWRVEEVRAPGDDHADGLLRLRAEMRLPGRAWLEFHVDGASARRTRLVQRALFAPRGVLGRLYWWALLPFHGPIFGSMARALAAQATQAASATGVTSTDAPTAPRVAPGAEAASPGAPEPPASRAG